MSLVMGIDTGGTYTDGVILDLDNNQVMAKSKVLTTHDHLTEGISNCIRGLKCDDFEAVSVVALSTTLATNAIVEGRGGEVGLLLLGSEPIDRLPVKNYVVIPGGHDVTGEPQDELDLGEVRKAVNSFKGKVDAVAVSGFFSIRNPEHELKTRKLVREILDVPVVCAHELSTTLGFYERTVTAALNARLIPVIANLIEAVKRVLQEMDINAPLMIVKGDGSLMSEVMTREKPVDTILSGPAASIFGATFKAETKDALLLDMGGTTTDIAILQNGRPRVNEEGAVVGGWATRVQAAEINTYGIGGDSYIRVDEERRLVIGPHRVWPLALAATKYPYLVDELQWQLKQDGVYLRYAQPTDCFALAREPVAEDLTAAEQKIIEILRQGPHNLFSLAYKLNKEPYFITLDNLVDSGILARASVTPTDILHASGVYTQWNREASILGIQSLARKMNLPFEEFLELAMEAIVDKLSLSILQSLSNYENSGLQLQDEPGAMYFIRKILGSKDESVFNCNLHFDFPVVAIGAPVRAYLPKVAEKLNIKLIIPESAEIANAIGAASGEIVEVVEVLIKQNSISQYSVYAPKEKREFAVLKDAKEYALAEASYHAALRAEKAGADSYELIVNQEDIEITTLTGWKVYVETKTEVTAMGRPKWKDE